MKKKILLLLFAIFFTNTSFAESYYFKKCKLSDNVTGNYVIDFKKNVIEVELKSTEGKVQNFSDEIKLIEKDKIISEKIKSAKGTEIYYQYFLNSKSKSVIKLQYKKETGIDMIIFKLNSKSLSYCLNVKADWDKQKLDEAGMDE